MCQPSMHRVAEDSKVHSKRLEMSRDRQTVRACTNNRHVGLCHLHLYPSLNGGVRKLRGPKSERGGSHCSRSIKIMRELIGGASAPPRPESPTSTLEIIQDRVQPRGDRVSIPESTKSPKGRQYTSTRRGAEIARPGGLTMKTI